MASLAKTGFFDTDRAARCCKSARSADQDSADCGRTTADAVDQHHLEDVEGADADAVDKETFETSGEDADEAAAAAAED